MGRKYIMLMKMLMSNPKKENFTRYIVLILFRDNICKI